jgi:hypothetical protein
VNCFDCMIEIITVLLKKFEMFVDFRCPIRVECIFSCSTTSAFCPANPARGYILAEFCYSLTDFRANLSSLIKTSLFWELYGIILAGDIDYSWKKCIKGEKSRIVSSDICQVWAILVSMFPSFPRDKEGTGGRGQIEPGPPVTRQVSIYLNLIYVQLKPKFNWWLL